MYGVCISVWRDFSAKVRHDIAAKVRRSLLLKQRPLSDTTGGKPSFPVVTGMTYPVWSAGARMSDGLGEGERGVCVRG